MIAQNILVTQLHSDLGGDVRKVVQILDRENTASGHVRDFGKQGGPIQLFRRPAAISARFINSDGVELAIGFLNQPLDIALVVPTMIIASIGDDEQGPLGVMCTPELAEAQIDGIQEGGAAPGRGEHHAGLQLLDAVGENAGELGALVEADQEEFILWVGGLEELDGGFAGLGNLVGHAAAEVEDDADGNGHVLGGEMDNLLLDVVLEDAEIFGVQTGDQAAVGIGDSDVDQSQVHVNLQSPSGLEGDPRSVSLGVVWSLGAGRGKQAAAGQAGEEENAHRERSDANRARAASHGSPIGPRTETSARTRTTI